MEPKYARDRKASKSHHTITLICFAVVLMAIVCTAIFIVGMNRQLYEIKEQILGIQVDLTASATEDSGTKPTEDSIAGNTKEHTPHNFVLGVTVRKTRDIEIGTAYDFGDYAKTAKVTTTVAEGEKKQAIAVSFVPNEGTPINLDLVYVQEGADDLIVGVKCNSDLYLFDSRAFTYEWQYRTGVGPWTPVERDIVTQSNEDYSCMACKLDWINSICTAEQPIELRCNIQIKNASGDSMLLTVDGILVAADGTLVTDNP